MAGVSRRRIKGREEGSSSAKHGEREMGLDMGHAHDRDPRAVYPYPYNRFASKIEKLGKNNFKNPMPLIPNVLEVSPLPHNKKGAIFSSHPSLAGHSCNMSPRNVKARLLSNMAARTSRERLV